MIGPTSEHRRRSRRRPRPRAAAQPRPGRRGACSGMVGRVTDVTRNTAISRRPRCVAPPQAPSVVPRATGAVDGRSTTGVAARSGTAARASGMNPIRLADSPGARGTPRGTPARPARKRGAAGDGRQGGTLSQETEAARGPRARGRLPGLVDIGVEDARPLVRGRPRHRAAVPHGAGRVARAAPGTTRDPARHPGIATIYPGRLGLTTARRTRRPWHPPRRRPTRPV